MELTNPHPPTIHHFPLLQEDREIFSEKLREIDETLALSYPGVCVDVCVNGWVVGWLDE